MLCICSISHEKVMDNLVVVYDDGTASFVPVHRVESTCIYDLTWFPFDTQTCNLKYGSWTYDGSKVRSYHITRNKGNFKDNSFHSGITVAQYHRGPLFATRGSTVTN